MTKTELTTRATAWTRASAAIGALLLLTACAAGQIGTPRTPNTAPAQPISGAAGVEQNNAQPSYLIGPYDKLEVFVWRAEELSTNVTVRPDGRISVPLVQDMQAAGKTPTELANDLEVALTEYVKAPEVNVIVREFSAPLDQQVRVLGEAQRPLALPHQADMTVLDVMLGVGGLTEFAAGNRARLIRREGTERKTYRLRLDDLMRRGDVSANVAVQPGDVILIPQTRF